MPNPPDTSFLTQLLHEDTLMPIMLGFVGVVFIVTSAICSIFKRQAIERSRREIAAYIAEGSMTPDQGERLLKATSKDMKSCC